MSLEKRVKPVKPVVLQERNLTSGDGMFRLIPLDSVSAWDEAQETARTCDRSEADGNPWTIPEYFRIVANVFPLGEEPWFLALHERTTGTLLGCTFFRVETQKRKLGSYRVLRSFDQMAFRLPALLAVPGKEHHATRIFAQGLRVVGRALGAQLWCWYRLDSALLPDLQKEIAYNRLPARLRLFTESPTLGMGDDFDRFCAGKRNVLPDIRRRERRMLAENPDKVKFRHLWSTDPATGEGAEVWGIFEQVRSASWQRQWLERSGKADVETVESYYRQISEAWSSRGWLGLQSLEIAGEPAAAQVWLAMPSRTWLIVFAYDRRFQRHGAGNVLMFRSLESWHRLGGRFIEFGGECLGWKSDWADGSFDVYQLEVGLGDLRSRMWAFASWLAAEYRSVSLRIAGWKNRKTGSSSPVTPRDTVRTGRENEL